MNNETKLKPTIIKSSQSPVHRAFGDTIRFHLTGAQTGGAITMFTDITPPGGGPPPHFHEREDEWFHVLEGCVSFFVEGRWHDAHPGDSVFAPRGVVHAFKNNTATPTKLLIHTSPSGFEKFFAEEAEEFAKPGGPDMNRAFAIAAKHGIKFVQ
jgi:quercetin dioxygenase-like cupin family protein